MALSNWNTLAFGPDGTAVSGEFELRDGATLEIYKNWIYIRHPRAWFEENYYTDDIVMEIRSGDLKYAGCNIVASRHESQSAVFVFAEDRNYPAKTSRYFAGLSCSGYLSTVEWIERNDPEKLNLFPKGWENMDYLCGSSHDPEDGDWEVVDFFNDDGYETVKLYLFDERPDTYVGILPETHAAFIEWLERTVAEIVIGDEADKWL